MREKKKYMTCCNFYFYNGYWHHSKTRTEEEPSKDHWMAPNEGIGLQSLDWASSWATLLVVCLTWAILKKKTWKVDINLLQSTIKDLMYYGHNSFSPFKMLVVDMEYDSTITLTHFSFFPKQRAHHIAWIFASRTGLPSSMNETDPFLLPWWSWARATKPVTTLLEGYVAYTFIFIQSWLGGCHSASLSLFGGGLQHCMGGLTRSSMPLEILQNMSASSCILKDLLSNTTLFLWHHIAQHMIEIFINSSFASCLDGCLDGHLWSMKSLNHSKKELWFFFSMC